MDDRDNPYAAPQEHGSVPKQKRRTEPYRHPRILAGIYVAAFAIVAAMIAFAILNNA